MVCLQPHRDKAPHPREEPDVFQDCEEDEVIVLTRRVLGRVVRMCYLSFSDTAISLEKLYGAMFPSMVMAHSLRILFEVPAHAGRIVNSDGAMVYLQPNHVDHISRSKKAQIQ